MMGIPIKYASFYGGEIPENPVELILNIPKDELIATIVSVNSRLKPIASNHFDDSRDTQVECLKSIFLDNKQNDPRVYNCLPVLRTFLRLPDNNILFTRVTCLYALQEIINCNDFVEKEPEYNFKNREQIFKFLLIVNDKTITGDENYKNEGHEELGNDFFEFFMFRELHHNQYNVCSNAINTFYKSWFLLNKIENDLFFGKHFQNFLTWKYQVESIEEVLKFIIWSYINSEDEVLGIRYLNVPNDNLEAIKVLDVLSAHIEYELPIDGDLTKFDFFQLKKSPLYKSKTRDGKNIISYVLLDDGFFLEKFYSLFINDFWFDFLKPNEICDRKQWGDFIGSKFFEPFIEDILSESFSNSDNVILRSTTELLFKIEGRPIEYADFYVRENQNVALFEVKSGFIPLDHGYKTVSNIDDYRNLDLNKFNKDYGLKQLAEKTLKKFHLYKKEIDDPYFNYGRKVQIYPIIVVNDPIISSGIMPFVLKRNFNELLDKENVSKKTKDHNIKDLIIINISQLQDIEQSLKDRKVNFFSMLDLYLSMSDASNPNNNNNKGYKFLRTFEHVLGAKVKDGLISERVKELKWLKI